MQTDQRDLQSRSFDLVLIDDHSPDVTFGEIVQRARAAKAEIALMSSRDPSPAVRVCDCQKVNKWAPLAVLDVVQQYLTAPGLVRAFRQEDLPLLAQMYASFEPKGAFLGLPPGDPLRRSAWLQNLLEEGINFMAFSQGCLVGHLALMPTSHSAEMAIFVHQNWRGRGFGSELVGEALKAAAGRGLRHIWALTTIDNTAAVRMLTSRGFRQHRPPGATSETILARPVPAENATELLAA
jgi:ribosomal protein S18 acetylase RimI-like enzyme